MSQCFVLILSGHSDSPSLPRFWWLPHMSDPERPETEDSRSGDDTADNGGTGDTAAADPRAT